MKAPLDIRTTESSDETLLQLERLRTKNAALETEIGALNAKIHKLNQQLESIQQEQERARMFMSAIDQCSESIFFTDLFGSILYVNHSFERTSGYSRAELLGQSPRLLKSGAHPPDFYQNMWSTILRGEIWRSRMANRRKDGTIYHEEVNITPVRNDEGQITGFVSIKTDITELLQNKQALEAANAELSRSNLELEQFAYVASHDLQEPLRAVSSCMQLLERNDDDKLDTRSHEFIQHAVGACKRMRALIDGLLTLSRVHPVDGQLEPTNTCIVLDQACSNLATAIEDSGATISHGQLPTTCAHPQMLVQLFQNLLSNAIKFAGTTPPRVHIDAQRDGKWWIFSVRDEGIGIEPSHFERIFQLFQRLHTRDEYPGTGLGLPICKKIVSHHGGHIWVESGTGMGSTFYFTLPAILADGKSCPAPNPPPTINP